MEGAPRSDVASSCRQHSATSKGCNRPVISDVVLALHLGYRDVSLLVDIGELRAISQLRVDGFERKTATLVLNAEERVADGPNQLVLVPKFVCDARASPAEASLLA